MKFNKIFFRFISLENILKLLYKDITVFIHPSHKIQKFTENLKEPNSIYKIIPNGVNIKHFLHERDVNKISELKKSLNIDENDKVILYIGRIALEKRVLELVSSIKDYLKSKENIKMLIVGDGPTSGEVKNFCIKNELLEKVIFTGFVEWDKIPLYYSLGDVFVTASISENNSISMIEACLEELPVVCRKDMSYDLMVKNCENGFQIDKDEDFAEKIDFLLSNEEIRANMGKKSKDICSIFSAENYINSVQNFYEEIINKKIGIIK